VARFRAEGIDGLRDRSSRPHSSPSQTPPATCTAIEASRRQRHTGKQIAAEVGVSPATVSRVLRRLGAGGPCSGGALFPLQVQVTGGRIVVTAGPDA
jgi:CRP-like cAMP-binding protein